MGEEKDGRIVLTLLNNDLEVIGDFFPSIEEGLPINLSYMNTLFEKSNIVYGVQHEEIHKAFRACVEDGEIVNNVLIARGDPPVDEVPQYLKMNPYLIQKNKARKRNEMVDHRARSAFTIVKKGQILAKLKYLQPGKDGKNVHGDVVPFKVAKPNAILAGDNTQMEGDFLVSRIHGQMEILRTVLHVRENLLIKGAVGYRTGNIFFPGDVEIAGPVSDGFKIHCGGSITMKQTLDATDVIAKKDLLVAGGIIGRGAARMKVGGSLKTKFVENCHLAVRQDAFVESEIISSKLFTLGLLEMGEKGKIVGGEVFAVKGIRAGGLGKKTGKAAKIHCGVDFTLEREKEKCKDIMRVLATQKSRLNELMNDPTVDNEKKAKMEIILQKLNEEQEKAQNKIIELLGKLNVYEDAVIEIAGDIVPGTLIEICQSALYVTEPLNKVRIRLGKESQKLITEKM